MAALTLDQPPPRPAHDMGHQIGDIWKITLCLKKIRILSFLTLPSNPRTLISQWEAKLIFIFKKGLWTTKQHSSSFSPYATMLLLFSLVQDWLEIKNVKAVAFFSWRRVLVVTLDALTKVLESTFLDSPLEGAAIPIDYTFVSYHAFLFRSTFHYHALIGTLWTASLFGNDLLWSWSFATGVNYFNQLLKFDMFDCAYWHRVFYNKVPLHLCYQCLFTFCHKGWCWTNCLGL